MMSLGIYIHIPFCVKKCNYCDFVSFPIGNTEAYFEALLKEIDMYSSFLKERRIDTVFIGGGTPSAVDYKYVGKILSKLDLGYAKEVTIEANPKTLDSEKLKAYLSYGINRISMGMQSANDNELKILGRIHSHYDFLKSYELIVKSGFSNINVDTMFGIPEQTLKSFKNTLSEIKRLNPSHVSSYSLIVEEGTPFYTMNLNLPDEDTEREMFECIKDELYGYERYEISNYSKTGYECLHNIKYWQMEDFLGIGLNSYSFVGNKRFNNYSDMKSYISSVKSGRKPVFEVVSEDINELFKDAVITGLRMCKGINLDEIKERYNVDIFEKNEKKIKEYVSSGFMSLKGNILSFTEKGFSVSNFILSNLI